MTAAPPCQWARMAEALDDGRLEDDARASFERHAAGCVTCRREIDNAGWLRRRMDQLPVPGVTDFEHRRERDRLLGRAVRLRLDRGQRTGARGLWLAAAAACALIILVGIAGARLTAHHPVERDRASGPPAVASDTADGPPQYEITSLAQGVWSTEESGRTARISLTEGSAAFHVHRLKPGQRFLVTLPDSEIEVRGTRFVVDIEKHRTRYVVVMEGKVAFRRAGAPEALLLGGQRWDAPVPVAVGAPSATPSREMPPTPTPAKVRRRHVRRSATSRGAATSSLAPAASGRSSSPASPSPLVSPSPPSVAESPVSAASEQFAYAMGAFRGGRYDDADGLLREFIARNPADPRVEDAAFLRMVGRVRAHDPQGAAEIARRYLAQFPDGLRRREAEQVLQAPR